jgi:hypothetical protein
MSMIQLADKLRTEGDAYRLLEQMRWGDRPICPHCGSVSEHYFLNPANGRSRKTRTGADVHGDRARLGAKRWQRLPRDPSGRARSTGEMPRNDAVVSPPIG